MGVVTLETMLTVSFGTDWKSPLCCLRSLRVGDGVKKTELNLFFLSEHPSSLVLGDLSALSFTFLGLHIFSFSFVRSYGPRITCSFCLVPQKFVSDIIIIISLCHVGCLVLCSVTFLSDNVKDSSPSVVWYVPVYSFVVQLALCLPRSPFTPVFGKNTKSTFFTRYVPFVRFVRLLTDQTH